jgi:hypothetical protein
MTLHADLLEMILVLRRDCAAERFAKIRAKQTAAASRKL